LVGADGEQIGVIDTREALRQARDLDLDLVEVAPQADPPVCRIMDYGKFKYERDVRQKEARKKQSRTGLKEIKFRPKIDPHDYATKKGHVARFLKGGNKVKVTIMFRGREMAHTDLGRKILDRLVADLGETIVVESFPKQEGRNMIMVIGPNKRYVEAQAKEAAKLARDSEQPASETEATETEATETEATETVATETEATETEATETEATETEATETEATETELVDSVPAAETPASNDEG
jgi:translation initiation factor IF-3